MTDEGHFFGNVFEKERLDLFFGTLLGNKRFHSVKVSFTNERQDKPMKFRPCIDLHNGVVKQIVGSTLSTSVDVKLVENFVATLPASSYATNYKNDGLFGGHIIMLGPGCEEAALKSLQAFPNGMQIGGGINLDNAMTYINAGASHIIVTSFVFKDGAISFENLERLRNLVGKQRLVIDSRLI